MNRKSDETMNKRIIYCIVIVFAVILSGCRMSVSLTGGTVDGMNDHRVVMSAAVAATACAGPVTILGAEAVNKSYPHFWKDFAALGGQTHV